MLAKSVVGEGAISTDWSRVIVFLKGASPIRSTWSVFALFIAMSSVSDLQAKFGRGAAVQFEQGPNDVSPVVVLRTANGSCRVLVYAAHVLSWKDASGSERLFLRHALSPRWLYFRYFPDGISLNYSFIQLFS